MCRKCLTSWSLGQFKMKTIPSSHQRRRRRQNLIENLQKTLKSASKDKSTKEIKKLQRKIDHHQDLNNHVMVITLTTQSLFINVLISSDLLRFINAKSVKVQHHSERGNRNYLNNKRGRTKCHHHLDNKNRHKKQQK